MKRHHIVGIFAGICAVGLAARSLLSGNIFDAFINFILLSAVAISVFFKDKLPPQLSRPMFPSWVHVVMAVLLFLCGFFSTIFSKALKALLFTY